MGIKHMNGCKVDIDGEVHYSLIPLHITGFHGSVHLSGEPGYPNRDLYFGIEPKGRIEPILSVAERKP